MLSSTFVDNWNQLHIFSTCDFFCWHRIKLFRVQFGIILTQFPCSSPIHIHCLNCEGRKMSLRQEISQRKECEKIIRTINIFTRLSHIFLNPSHTMPICPHRTTDERPKELRQTEYVAWAHAIEHDKSTCCIRALHASPDLTNFFFLGWFSHFSSLSNHFHAS